jgi:hypothetical protein
MRIPGTLFSLDHIDKCYLRKLRFDLIISFPFVKSLALDIPISSSNLVLLLQPFKDIAIPL